MSIYTYTHTYTRAEAVVDQVDLLFSEAGIDEIIRSRVCDTVNQRWLEAVGLFLKRDGNRVYEIEATISWGTYSDQADLSFSTDLPGWAGRGAPESDHPREEVRCRRSAGGPRCAFLGAVRGVDPERSHTARAPVRQGRRLLWQSCA